MLDLRHAYAGRHVSAIHILTLPHDVLLFYPFADTIVVLNARTLTFLRALAFWEAFPGVRHLKEPVKCIAIDSGMKLVVASMGSRVAAWSLSGVNGDLWRLHSTLLLPDDQPITALDCKSGLLAVGTRTTLSVHTLILDNDLPTWSAKWTFPAVSPACIQFSPSLTYIATTSEGDSTVRIKSTTSGRQTQAIPHLRPVIRIAWRRFQASSRDDPVLYTTTADGTLRIFLAVLDVPHHLQLHASLDTASVVPLSSSSVASSIFPLDRDALESVFLKTEPAEDTRSRRVREIAEGGWDLFLRVFADGSLVVQAVANIDRRPPTLLRHFPLLHSMPTLLSCPAPPEYLVILPPRPGDRRLRPLTLISGQPLASYALAPLPFFDARADGLCLIARAATESDGTRDVESCTQIVRFIRTPDGEGVGGLWEDGGGAAWGRPKGKGLHREGQWSGSSGEDLLVVLDAGRMILTYACETHILTLHTSPLVSLPVPPLLSLFSMPFVHASKFFVAGVTATHTIILFSLNIPSPSNAIVEPSVYIYSESSLPLPSPPKHILPVDPMAWSGVIPGAGNGAEPHDVVLSVSEEGDLAFWVPESAAIKDMPSPAANEKSENISCGAWRCTSTVRTGRRELSRAACSSTKKSVLVVPSPEGEEITIWDSKVSQFASGLEYRQVLSPSDPINDLDWSSTPDAQSILALGFAHRVEILCQQRMIYFDETPGWTRCWTIDLSATIPHPINDSVWLARGALLVSAGPFMYLFDQPPSERGAAESLFEYVAQQNGPLVDYHPQMVLQCLLWEKVELVKKVIVNLAWNVESGLDEREWKSVPLEHFLEKDNAARAVAHAGRKSQYSLLFTVPERDDESDNEQFSRQLVEHLMERLEERPLQHLTPNEHASLLVLIQTTLEVEEQRRALDANGLRYLISMRMFYISNRRLSYPNSPASNGSINVRIRPRQRLRYRDMIWAFHSESQELLLSASVSACGGKMSWPDARALGVFMWLHSGESMKAHMEVIARNEYMAGDNRDPTECSLFYFALGKVKLVHGLWRQAAWHKEQNVMLKFLSNDFSQPRWRTAALKNAFALLSKRRFEYAAAFFLLGGSLKDAVNVCIKNIQDFQLAVALARVVEQGDEGPILRDILSNTVVPLAFREGNRWLAGWAFWLLHRRDLAVRILVTPLQNMAAILDVRIDDIGDPHYDDPSLALLFSQLKAKTLQTAKGTSEISGRTEYSFVLQIARVFCRMGCHVLALDLVRSWSFHRPSTVVRDVAPVRRPPSPISTRFALEPAMRRKSSIMIDMDVTTAPPTRRASPEPRPANGVGVPPISSVEMLKEEGDLFARKAGLGSLIKSAKQDVQVPEFNMDNFF